MLLLAHPLKQTSNAKKTNSVSIAGLANSAIIKIRLHQRNTKLLTLSLKKQQLYSNVNFH